MYYYCNDELWKKLYEGMEGKLQSKLKKKEYLLQVTCIILNAYRVIAWFTYICSTSYIYIKYLYVPQFDLFL